MVPLSVTAPSSADTSIFAGLMLGSHSNSSSTSRCTWALFFIERVPPLRDSRANSAASYIDWLRSRPITSRNRMNVSHTFELTCLSTHPEEGAQLTRMDDMLGLTAPHEAHGFGLGLAGAKGGGHGPRGRSVHVYVERAPTTPTRRMRWSRLSGLHATAAVGAAHAYDVVPRISSPGEAPRPPCDV